MVDAEFQPTKSSRKALLITAVVALGVVLGSAGKSAEDVSYMLRCRDAGSSAAQCAFLDEAMG